MSVAEVATRNSVISRVEEQQWLETAFGERISIRVRSRDIGGAYTIIGRARIPSTGDCAWGPTSSTTRRARFCPMGRPTR